MRTLGGSMIVPVFAALALSLVAPAVVVADDDPFAAIDATLIDDAVEAGVAALLGMQEGDDNAEWPYEGVYRVRRRIPIGYRVGGTGIVGSSLLRAPDATGESDRDSAIERATRFVCRSVEDPLMKHAFESTYDVRGWGYAYGAAFLLDLQARDRVPEGLETDVKSAIDFYLAGIAATEIPERGGWNYARRAGFDKASAPSPFMTASTLQTLFEAARQGYDIDAAMVDRGLDALERSRGGGGGYVYAGEAKPRQTVGIPGSVGRMLAGETTLFLAGRSTDAKVRGAIDAFIVHWDWLEQRRAKNGTHVAPYGVAPYYFYYAHFFAAQAIEMLPIREREEYRRRFRALLFRTHDASAGTWNDRVFERSANYGTAMSIMALTMPESAAPAGWSKTSE